MLAALGLGRLEQGLAKGILHGAVTAELLEQADAVDVHTLAREGMPEALEYLHRRQARRLPDSAPCGSSPGPRHAVPSFDADFAERDEVTLPTRIHAPPRINKQFTGTGHANRV